MKQTKIILFTICTLMLAFAALASDKEKKGKKGEIPSVVLKTAKDTVAYAIGVSVAENLKMQGLDSVNADAMRQGMLDNTNGKAIMSAEDANKLLNAYFAKKQSAKFEKQKQAGEKFLEENKKNKDVITLPDGLQYIIMREGTGAKPTLSDKVTTHYHGTLIDGSVFDSSVERGEPVSFPVSGVIKGWTEALQLMTVGSKWKLFVPYDLAYGEQGAGGVIEPFATLIFEVELLSIDK